MAKTATAEPVRYDIWIAGEYEHACGILQEYVIRGECVSVTKVDYIFKYGREQGICVSLVNYPRFPRSQERLKKIAHEIADTLLNKLGQGSYMISGPDEHFYYDRRDAESG